MSDRDTTSSPQEDTVDALAARSGAGDDPDRDENSPAFEIDLDPEDQGSADAAAENPD